MPSLDWSAFESLPGSKSKNFENLCRGLMRLHFGRFGQFKALSNQPGVEFHIKLTGSCALGSSPQWFGWQCKFHRRNQNGDLAAASRSDIESSLRTTEAHLPEITDWILWTPYTLSKKDQQWFYNLSTDMILDLWVEEDLDTYLSGDGLMLRSTYFEELILAPHNLEEQHRTAVQPIRERWLVPVHQSVAAERTIRRMLGEPGSWEQLILVGKGLAKAADAITSSIDNTEPELQKSVAPFVTACTAFADTLLRFHETLAQGDLDVIQQQLIEQKTLISEEVSKTPRRLRTSNLPIALNATNALDDMRIAQELLDEVEEFLGVGLVAILADAGGGKTQMAAQLTASQVGRPAGVFLHGRDLHRGQTLNDFVGHFSINGSILTSMENLLAALDAAGKRDGCRLPILIDGLNEAENPKDWKCALASLGEAVRKYPNVLIVCTLRTGERRREDRMLGADPKTNDRESFAVMALPDSVRRIESEGFGGDVDEAIDKYFKYFKINPGDAEIPVELLQHPLTLRIFCQVMNPDRQSEVKIDYFPASLSPLFEKYIANACERISEMPNLSHSYSVHDVEAVVYRLGLEMWSKQQREIEEASFRDAVSDAGRPWNSSIVNLLAQEGIIFRNPGGEPGKFVITPAYDALGGHVIASALLTKYREDMTFSWLKEPEAIASFASDDSHELAYDIFDSLVALAPIRLHGRQLWKEAPDSLRNSALIYTIRLDAGHLDEDTVTALLTLLNDNPKARSHLFSRLKETKGVPGHPLNAEFTDRALREMSVAERDLSWSEWVRESRSERFNELLAIERRWKENLTLRTQSDRLRAKWVMWFLTSTDRELRDIATRTLYWFGRGDPAGLFDENIRSLEINDPYVPERMLAASYGVAMARHVDIGTQEFVDNDLPGYARNIYDNMFAAGAPFSTTHSLMREYAYRTIEIASFHNKDNFSSEEHKRCMPPFSEGGLRKWGKSEISEEEYHLADSPFRMDFENYTIGSLVPDRGNYNYKHEGYKEVRAKILWRVEKLGWSKDLFGDVDSSIGGQHYSSRTGSQARKTDRYGKKYSWIAYFEMSGLLSDKGVLEGWRERSSDVDIDPSFPERVGKDVLIKADYLGDPELDMQDWIVSGSSPDVNSYLCMTDIQGKQGPWVALDGFFVQEDEVRGRSVFCFIRSFIISNTEATSFVERLSNQYLGGRWLPDEPSVIYTFAGEIPWCTTFPDNGLYDFAFEVGEKTIRVQRTQQELYLDNERLEVTQAELMRFRLFGEKGMESGLRALINYEDLERIEVREVLVEVEEVQKEYMKFNAIIPVCDFGWEGYQTVASDAGSATLLAKEIAGDLDLIGQPQTFDMFTQNGDMATLNVSDQNKDFKNNQHMFFLRQDLLDAYLKKKDLALVWAIWGERGYSSGQVEKIFHGPDRPDQPYAVYSNIKRYE